MIKLIGTAVLVITTAFGLMAAEKEKNSDIKKEQFKQELERALFGKKIPPVKATKKATITQNRLTRALDRLVKRMQIEEFKFVTKINEGDLNLLKDFADKADDISVKDIQTLIAILSRLPSHYDSAIKNERLLIDYAKKRINLFKESKEQEVSGHKYSTQEMEKTIVVSQTRIKAYNFLKAQVKKLLVDVNSFYKQKLKKVSDVFKKAMEIKAQTKSK